jgi:hypothetical protein
MKRVIDQPHKRKSMVRQSTVNGTFRGIKKEQFHQQAKFYLKNMTVRPVQFDKYK